jgi:hypothetical protein
MSAVALLSGALRTRIDFPIHLLRSDAQPCACRRYRGGFETRPYNDTIGGPFRRASCQRRVKIRPDAVTALSRPSARNADLRGVREIALRRRQPAQRRRDPRSVSRTSFAHALGRVAPLRTLRDGW